MMYWWGWLIYEWDWFLVSVVCWYDAFTRNSMVQGIKCIRHMEARTWVWLKIVYVEVRIWIHWSQGDLWWLYCVSVVKMILHFPESSSFTWPLAYACLWRKYRAFRRHMWYNLKPTLKASNGQELLRFIVPFAVDILASCFLGHS